MEEAWSLAMFQPWALQADREPWWRCFDSGVAYERHGHCSTQTFS